MNRLDPILKLCFPCLLLLIFCDQSETNAPKRASINVDSLQAIPLNYLTPVLEKPTFLVSIDSLLFIQNRGKKLLIRTNLDTRSSQKYFSMGSGPNEFSGIFQLQRVNDQWIQFCDLNKKQLALFPANKDPVRSLRIIPYDLFQFDSNDRPTLPTYISDQLIVWLGGFHQGRLAVTGLDQNKNPAYVSAYPEDDRPDHQNESPFAKFQVFQGSLKLKPDGTKLVYSSTYNVFVEIFDVKDQTLVSSFRKIGPLPEYENSGNFVGFKQTRQRYLGIFDVTDDGIWFINHEGKSQADHGTDAYYGSVIDLYDWSGQLKRIYHLDRPIKFLAVNEDRKLLLGISENAHSLETEIVTYVY